MMRAAASSADETALVVGLVSYLGSKPWHDLLNAFEQAPSAAALQPLPLTDPSPAYAIPSGLEQSPAGCETCDGRPIAQLLALVNLYHTSPGVVCWEGKPLVEYITWTVKAYGFNVRDVIRIDIWAGRVSVSGGGQIADTPEASKARRSVPQTDDVTIEVTLV
ncbi:hypothetical protein AURDEDRAFT_159165 [Auricularia subglabra TFB-10046 SS5]|nr:hypothetical protein AURDEDRAFT_159165 [Auricularia subglabra TFB-10046 SS5]